LLVEREEHLNQFAERLDRLAEGAGGTVVVSGPVASGRTRLFRSFLSDVAERSAPGRDLAGTLVLTATGSPATGLLPFGLLTPVLTALRLQPDLLYEIESCVDAPLADGVLKPEAVSLAHRVAEAVLALAVERPVVLAVDDAQDGDELSLECLAYMARRLVAARMLLAVAVRTGIGHRGPVHAALLHEGIGRGLRLAPLSERGVTTLVADRLGRSAADRGAADFFAVTAGNCLLVNAVIEDHVARTGGLPLQRGTRLAVGEAYGRAVLACLDRGGADARRVAEVLAVVGGDKSAAMLADLAGVDKRGLFDALESLEEVGLLNGRAFRHPIARSTVLARLTTADRAEVHLRAAAHVQRNEGLVDEVVDHFLAAGEVRDQASVSLLQCVAEQALIADDVERATRCLRLAAAHCADERQRAAIVGRLASVVWRSSTTAVAQNHLKVLIEAMCDGILPDSQVPAVLRYLLWHGRVDEAVEAMSCLYGGGSTAEEVDSLQWWLRHCYPPLAERMPPRPDNVDEAAPATPGTAGAGRVMAAQLIRGLLAGDDPEEVAIIAQQVLQSCALGEDTIESLATALISLTYVDRLDLAQPWCDELVERAHERRAPTWAAVLGAVRADIALRAGDLAGAVRFGREALETMPAHNWGTNIGLVRAPLIVAHTRMDEYEEAAEQLRQPLPDGMFESRFGLHYLFARGQYYQAVDRPYAALTDFRACGDLLTKWGMDVSGIVAWRSAAAQCHLALGEPDQSRTLAETQLARSPRMSRSAGLALRVLATTAPPAQRVPLLEAAVDAFVRCGARFHLARALLDLGNTHHDLGDDEKARMTIRQAQRVAKECRARRLEREVPLQRVAEEETTMRRWEQPAGELSDAERRVATLAGLGHTNRQIADKLYVTISTVEQHLTRTYRKLGISRRSDITTVLRLQVVQAL
jgi:DNA-binding CsgD family transcriptional regulator